MKIFVATNPYSVVFENEQIIHFFELGLDYLYINKPNFSSLELDTFISLIPAEYHSRLIISKEIKIAEKYQVHGLMIESSLYKSFFYNYFTLTPFIKKNSNIRLFSQIKSLKEIKHLDSRIDTCIIYPVFAENYIENILDLKDDKIIVKSKEQTSIEIIAMGGVDDSRIADVLKFQFDGLVLQSAIWRSSDPLDAYNKSIQKVKDLSN